MKRARKRARFYIGCSDGLALAIELALLGHPLERFASTFDSILMFVAFGRQQFHHLKRAAGAKPAKRA
jgi:hypothetical protein